MLQSGEGEIMTFRSRDLLLVVLVPYQDRVEFMTYRSRELLLYVLVLQSGEGDITFRSREFLMVVLL